MTGVPALFTRHRGLARSIADGYFWAGADKGSHEWGQGVPGFRQLVKAFTQPGDTVCDPFLGGGTTAIAALAEGRRFVGCDVDERAVEITAGRLAG